MIKRVIMIMDQSESKHFPETLFKLPTEVQKILIQFLLKDYRQLILVGAKWYVWVHDILEMLLEDVDNK